MARYSVTESTGMTGILYVKGVCASAQAKEHSIPKSIDKRLKAIISISYRIQGQK